MLPYIQGDDVDEYYRITEQENKFFLIGINIYLIYFLVKIILKQFIPINILVWLIKEKF